MKPRLPVRAALTGSLSLLLAACAASQPAHAPVQISMRTVRSANYGVYPKNYERQIRQYLNETLLDGDSARIRIITPPRKVLRLSNQGVQGSGRAGWDAFYLACADVNAKNAYGGYTGWQTKMFRFKNNTIEGNPTGAYAACTSKDEIYIDTTLIFGGDQVNIVP